MALSHVVLVLDPDDYRLIDLLCLFVYSMQGLKSELEKASPSLGRSAVYLKDSHINGLPR